MPVLLSALDYVIASHLEHPKKEEPGSPEFWWKIGLSALLVVAGGVFAGYVTLSLIINDLIFIHRWEPSLTLGLMGLDVLHLRVLATSSDDPDEKRNAQKGDLITQNRMTSFLVLKITHSHKFST